LDEQPHPDAIPTSEAPLTGKALNLGNARLRTEALQYAKPEKY
jgi:hypothetical protein